MSKSAFGCEKPAAVSKKPAGSAAADEDNDEEEEEEEQDDDPQEEDEIIKRPSAAMKKPAGNNNITTKRSASGEEEPKEVEPMAAANTGKPIWSQADVPLHKIGIAGTQKNCQPGPICDAADAMLQKLI